MQSLIFAKEQFALFVIDIRLLPLLFNFSANISVCSVSPDTDNAIVAILSPFPRNTGVNGSSIANENQKFPEPIVTPTTKAEMGLHDEDISKEEILKQGLATPEEYEILEKYTLALFKRGTEIAAERGLILVDTKYEFGKHNGTIYLMDEIHTPDSSRYFYSEGYQERFEKGEPQKQLSKEFVREWLMENGFQGKDGQKVPEMTPAIVQSISDRYIELFENITGEKFVKEDTSNIAERIFKNVETFLNS